MSYWNYYLAWTLLAYGLRQPWLLAGVVLFLVLRRFIPDPGALFRALSRAGALRSQVDVNPANITARRDLALLYLDVLRPGAALKLVEQALVRAPDDAELLYLSGLALHRIGRHEQALEPLVKAVDKDPRLRFGQPYLVAGDALFALGRTDAAMDAYERYAETNGSDVAAHIRLARAHARMGDRDAARKAIDEAVRTWRVLPGRLKRRAFFGGYLRAQWARVWLLRQPGAVATALVLAATLVFVTRAAYPAVLELVTRSPSRHFAGHRPSPQAQRLLAAYERCGRESTGDFAGQYAAFALPELPQDPTETPEQRAAAQQLAKYTAEQYENFEIGSDRIRSGTSLVQEFCLVRVIERAPQMLYVETVWHEDVSDPGDASLVNVRLTREGDLVRFALAEPGQPDTWLATLKRK